MSRPDTADPARPDAGGGDRPAGVLDRLTPRQRTVLVVAIVLVAFALPLRGQLRNQGPPMEEGFMLVFPEMVLEGKVPNRDFLHLYGPGSLWVLAGVFKTFGTSLVAERLVGLAQQIGLVLGVLAIARLWGRTVALCCALIALVIIIPPIGLTALAWVGAVAFGLWALHLGLRARFADDPARAARLAFGAGLLAGFALLYRPDVALALTLGGIVVVRGLPWVRARMALAGLVAGLAPYLVHVWRAGLGTAIRGMVLDPVVYLRGGRRLPLPPSPSELQGFLQRAGDLYPFGWPLPMIGTPAQLTLWFFALPLSVVAIVVAAVRLRRREGASARAVTLMAVGLFSLGLLPQALQRADSTHLAWVSCVTFGFLPLAVQELIRARRPGWSVRRRGLLAGGGVLAALLLLVPAFTARSYADAVWQTFGKHRLAYEIRHGGRTFYYGRPDVARAMPELLRDVERVSEPGDRLFVGTSDLRKTPYVDSFIYYLLPDLEPATYYIEMDPGVANREGSRLADDVRSADVVVLTSVWDAWDEPNDSRVVGSDEPNQVLRDDFCRVGTYEGLYELLERC